MSSDHSLATIGEENNWNVYKDMSDNGSEGRKDMRSLGSRVKLGLS